MDVTRAEEIHGAVEARLNAGDVDGILELYEDRATMVAEDGSRIEGLDAIRDLWTSMAGLGGRMTLTTRYVHELGDLALLRNRWTFESEAYSASGETAEVARRQADGTWKYVIDCPFGANPPTT